MCNLRCRIGIQNPFPAAVRINFDNPEKLNYIEWKQYLLISTLLSKFESPASKRVSALILNVQTIFGNFAV